MHKISQIKSLQTRFVATDSCLSHSRNKSCDVNFLMFSVRNLIISLCARLPEADICRANEVRYVPWNYLPWILIVIAEYQLYLLANGRYNHRWRVCRPSINDNPEKNNPAVKGTAMKNDM